MNCRVPTVKKNPDKSWNSKTSGWMFWKSQGCKQHTFFAI